MAFNLQYIVTAFSVTGVLIAIISKIKSTPRILKKEIGKEVFYESMLLLAKFALEYEPDELYSILKQFASQQEFKDDMHATIEVISEVFEPEGAFKGNPYFKKLDDEKRESRYKILTKRKAWRKVRYSEKVNSALGKVWEVWWANRKIRIMKVEQNETRREIKSISNSIEDRKMSNQEKRKAMERRRKKERRKKELARIKSKGDDLHELFKR